LPELVAETFLGPLAPNVCPDLDPPNPLQCARFFPSNSLDAAGNFYFVLNRNGRSEIWRHTATGATELVADLLSTRPAPNDTVDIVVLGGVYTDLVNGFLYVRFSTECFPALQCDYDPAREVVRVRGLGTLLEVLESQVKDLRTFKVPW